MVGRIRLFEKTDEGLLVEVAPGDAEARRGAGTVSRVALEADVLWTAGELAAREAEEAAIAQARLQRQAEAQTREKRLVEVREKLAAIGITPAELKAVLS